MSALEIISELPQLSRSELEAVGAKLHELLGQNERPGSLSWGQTLAKFAGSVDELPANYALNHDHYLHQAPKR